MDNHYHILVENMRENLSSGMRQLNAQYASYFNLDIDALMQARQQKIATVHHNAEGRITKIQ